MGAELVALADGMSGHANGRLASDRAVVTLSSCFDATHGTGRHRLLTAVKHANCAVYRSRQAARSDMASTLVAATWTCDTLHFVAVGDSRIYLFRGQRLRQLSADHRLSEAVKELLADDGRGRHRVQVGRDVILRAIGPWQEVEPAEGSTSIEKGDLFLLASDGMFARVSHASLEECLRTHSETSLHLILHQLTRLALSTGETDDISGVAVRFT